MDEMDKDLSSQKLLTQGHYSAFGCIIHVFARHDMLIVAGISQLVGGYAGRVMHLTAEMPYRAKKDAFVALLKSLTLPGDQVERICWFLGEINAYIDLRNAIAHNTWARGDRPESIKPLSLVVRGGKTMI